MEMMEASMQPVSILTWRPVFFPHGPLQELINGAKMALNYLITFPIMAICVGISSIIPHI